MTVFFNALQEAYLGYAAVFFCVGAGFLALRKASGREVGPGYWATSFLLGSAGFLCWSGLVPQFSRLTDIVGEVLHVLGFLSLVCGSYRFTGGTYTHHFKALLGAWTFLWLVSLFLLGTFPFVAGLALKALRAGLFVAAGIMILRRIPSRTMAGRGLSGWSLIAWGAYVLMFAFVSLPEALLWLAFGFMAGFQVLAALGMIALAIDRVRLRADETERQVRRLERFLNVCAFCGRIHDKQGTWKPLDAYLAENTDTEFSHGLCPECAKKHYPEYYDGEDGK